ncbi:MAG: zinc ribbon domain-containing protein, partial [Acidobacteria bacterium]
MRRALFCTECGAPLPEANRFCTQCGKALPAPAPEAPTPPPMPQQRPAILEPPPIPVLKTPVPPMPPHHAAVPPIPPPLRRSVRARPAKAGTGFKDTVLHHKGLFGCLAAVIALGGTCLVIVVIVVVSGLPEGQTGKYGEPGPTDLAGEEAPAEADVERLGPEQPVDPLLA